MSDPCLQVFGLLGWLRGVQDEWKPMRLRARSPVSSSDSYCLHVWYEEGIAASSALSFCLIGLLCGMNEIMKTGKDFTNVVDLYYFH